ncbi:hypothetical protein GCM10022253_20490 [Sphingomonas endophytica]|uniref:Response regulatory domain-containing protein n=1 Tax=Sphingomonas endophytica TaxID=869719 RepID=A0ABR6N1N0_9SPHN|nr:hypothetical protein [Sphingomonas endophytica]MBB5724693.1 hypothetical protein [Sphingomonas endophytica]
MSKTGVFVDDKEKVYARLLSRQCILDFEHFLVDTDIASLANRILERNPDVVALDYRLDEEVGDLAANKTFKASALAQHLRDKAVSAPAEDFPIVLVSAETKIRSLFDPDRTAHDLFDKVFVKEQIRVDAKRAQTELISLANAYETLAQQQAYSLETFLDTSEEDRAFTDLQELRTPVETASAPHQVVGFLLKQLFNKPGLLLDDADTAARLGITQPSFEAVRPKLFEAGLAYSGQLAEGWPRWWAHRVEAWLEEKLGTRPITTTALERAKRLGTALELSLEPARSPWTRSDDEKISFACASCRRGAEVRHSVSAFEGAVPRYRIARRICWDCVQTGRYEHEHPTLRIDELDERVAAKVRTMNKPAAR